MPAVMCRHQASRGEIHPIGDVGHVVGDRVDDGQQKLMRGRGILKALGLQQMSLIQEVDAESLF